MSIAPKINPLLALEYMQTESENKYFDRKFAQTRVVELAQHISAFASADDGTLVIGISDKKRTLEGINLCGDEKINEFESSIDQVIRIVNDRPYLCIDDNTEERGSRASG